MIKETSFYEGCEPAKAEGKKCVGCGKPATRICQEVCACAVCGEPLCDNCEHGAFNGHGVVANR